MAASLVLDSYFQLCRWSNSKSNSCCQVDRLCKQRSVWLCDCSEVSAPVVWNDSWPASPQSLFGRGNVQVL